ncbi:MAG: site-2 protease family protein [Clostridia bacterium]|nr:site-2 protease family protein [Clostridia bacterium]
MITVLYIILAIFAFGLMIAIHEGGHFFAARACGVKVYEFSLGMGPRIFGKRGKDGTEYNLRLFPIGGYVSMKGEDEDADGEDSFSQKKPWQRFIIVAAGATMNIILGVILCLILTLSTPLASNVVAEFLPESTSHEWLMPGDEIVEINGTKVYTYDDMHYEITHDGYEPLDIVVIRDNERVLLEDVVFPTIAESGMVFGDRDFIVFAAKKTFGGVVKHTWFMAVSTVRMIWESLFDLLLGRVGVEAVSGPVGVTEAIGTAAKNGLYSLAYLLSVLTMNLGVFNLLPIPALDGGRLVFILFEMVFRRKVPPKFEGLVHTVGIMLLFGLMIFVTFKDVIKLIS